MKRFTNDKPLFTSRALTPARQSNPFGGSLLSHPFFKIAIISTVVVGIFGLGLYSYQNSRDETTVAVLEPTTPATRLRPADPEGMDIPHRDRLIYNRLSSDGSAERLNLPARDAARELAVQRPVPLDDLQAEVAADTPPVKEPLRDVAVTRLDASAALPMQPAIAPVQPTSGILPTPDAAANKDRVAASAAISSTLPVINSPSIASAPIDGSSATASKPTDSYASITPIKPVAPLIAKKTVPFATAPVSQGGYRVQIAAFRSEEEAIKAWAQFQKQYPALASLKPTIEQADIAGRGSFHRLQTQAFNTKTDAEALCAGLKKAGRDCLVVKR